MSKRLYILISAFVCAVSKVFASGGFAPGIDPYAPDIELLDWESVGKCLLIALFTVPIGWLIAKYSESWRWLGCIGVIVGLIFLFPLIEWICVILQLAVGVVIVVWIVIAIFVWIFSKDK